MRKGGQPTGPAAEAVRLFDAGDKIASRVAAEKLLAASPSPEDAAVASDLLARLRLPGAVLRFGLLAASAITFLILLALARS